MAQANHKRSQVDWKGIETRYIAGSESQSDLARILGVDRSALCKRAIRGKWDEKRESNHRTAQGVALNLSMQALALDKAAVDTITNGACTVAGAKLGAALAQLDPAEEPKAYAMLMQSLKLVQDVAYRALGIAPPVQRNEVVVWNLSPQEEQAIRERLSMQGGMQPLDVEGKVS